MTERGKEGKSTVSIEGSNPEPIYAYTDPLPFELTPRPLFGDLGGEAFLASSNTSSNLQISSSRNERND